MKTYKIIYWISTSLLFIFQGVMPALTGHTEMAKEGIRHLGYPEYFGTALTVAKVIGAVALILPQVPRTVREWAYAGFAFDFTFAFISLVAVDGWMASSFFPLVTMAVLIISYYCYHRLRAARALSSVRSL
ncbi:MAG TPA: DoxX family protein [Chitinophagaceae bacterium]|nr:DoxX family protein [Chitinophagaceae bacterium]